MKILVLSNVPPAAVGGAEVQAWNLAGRWAGMGHTVMVAGHANAAVAAGNPAVLRIPTLRRWRWLRAVSYLTATVWLLWSRRREYDVVYCRFLNEQAIAACVAKSLLRLEQPVVACPESAAAHGDVHAIRTSPIFPLLRRLLDRNLAVIVAISSRIEAELGSLGLSQPRVMRLCNGVVIPPPGGRQEGVGGGVRRLLFVGRLVEVKCVGNLIEVVQRLRRDGLPLTLEVVGDGPLRGHLEQLSVRLGVHDCVRFCGVLPPAGVSEALHRADVFVLPSRFEGLPLALLEAMAHGLPSIATRVSGAEDIVDEQVGWLVAVDDVAALADAVRTACTMDERAMRAMGARARERAMHSFDIDRVARELAQMFTELTLAHASSRKYSATERS